MKKPKPNKIPPKLAKELKQNSWRRFVLDYDECKIVFPDGTIKMPKTNPKK